MATQLNVVQFRNSGLAPTVCGVDARTFLVFIAFFMVQRLWMFGICCLIIAFFVYLKRIRYTPGIFFAYLRRMAGGTRVSWQTKRTLRNR